MSYRESLVFCVIMVSPHYARRGLFMSVSVFSMSNPPMAQSSSEKLKNISSTPAPALLFSGTAFIEIVCSTGDAAEIELGL
mmetsp:Transcript_21784/g.32569  ORF Transcript_21784/g.32569 Transcript_21784/m.32569 type:complete len:81 (-) Transcript_21784:1752-1994(-)